MSEVRFREARRVESRGGDKQAWEPGVGGGEGKGQGSEGKGGEGQG